MQLGSGLNRPEKLSETATGIEKLPKPLPIAYQNRETTGYRYRNSDKPQKSVGTEISVAMSKAKP